MMVVLSLSVISLVRREKENKRMSEVVTGLIARLFTSHLVFGRDQVFLFSLVTTFNQRFANHSNHKQLTNQK